MKTPVLRTHLLTLHAGGRCLLRELDWRVHAGERWCVIGRNASGKSTLLRALAGLPVPQRSGEVLWLERPQSDWAAQDGATLRAYMPQQAVDRFAIRVRRLLALSVVATGAPDAERVLAALDVAAMAEREVTQLSGGERQRVALAQCAVQGAQALLLDEPVSVQDPAHQRVVARWLETLADRAIVASAHDMNWVAQTATHVLALDGHGGWEAGPMAAMLTAGRLEQVFGCAWREADGIWVAR